MASTSVYHYKINRRQRSKLFIRMGLACIAYVAGLFFYENYTGQLVAEHFRSIYIYSFSVVSAVLFFTAWWHFRNPATYEATLSSDRFVIHYPDSTQWSFDVRVADIVRFEHRQSHAGGARGIAASGIVMKNGDFHEIVMNYGNSINQMHAAIQSINPDITFSKSVNRQS